MGGLAPLGYEVRDRRLLVNPDEAPKVKHIFDRFLELRELVKYRNVFVLETRVN